MATRDTWVRRVQDWKWSGLTAAEYAAGEGLNAMTLRWWSSQLNRPAPRTPPVVEVVGAAVARRESDSDFEVVLADDTRVVVPAGFDAGGLRRLLGVLRES